MTDAQNAGTAAPEAGASPSGRPVRELVREGAYRYDPRSKSVALACFLSLMPGLGQVYVGYYQRGFIHVLVVGSVIATLANNGEAPIVPLLGLFLAFFWMYNIIDAGRRAALYNQALAGSREMTLPDDFEMPGAHGSVGGGVVLIVLGTLLLLDTRFGVSLSWLKDWWPLGPILFGAWLLYKGLQNTKGRG